MKQLYIEYQQKLCRICLGIVDSEENSISIFDHVQNPANAKNELSFSLILEKIATVKVNKHDGLTEKICNFCVQQLQSYLVLKARIEKSNDILERAKSKSNDETSGALVTASPKRCDSPSRVSEPAIPPEDDSETDNNEAISDEPPTTQTLASNSNAIIIEQESDGDEEMNEVSTSKTPQSSSSLKKVDMNGNGTSESHDDKHETDEIVSANVHNLKDAILVLENFDSLDIITCETCRRFFCTETAYLRHDSACVHDPNNNEPVKYTRDEFEEKFIETPSKGLSLCKICEVSFEKKDLTSHLNTHHLVNRPLKCSFCDEKFIPGSERVSHMKTKHPQNYKCANCSSQFVDHARLENHCVERCFVLTSVPKSHLEVADEKPLYVEQKKPIEMNKPTSKFRSRTPKATKRSVQTQQMKTQTEANGNTSQNGNNESLTTTQPAIELTTGQLANTLNTEKSNSPAPLKLSTEEEPMNTDESDYDDDYEGFGVADYEEREKNGFDLLAQVVEEPPENGDHGEHMLGEPSEAINFVETELVENGEHVPELEENAITYTYEEFHEKFVQRVDDPTKLKCKPCGNEIKKHSMKLHIRNGHSTKPSFFCELCDERFMKYDHRTQHMKKMHSDDFICELCERQFFYSMTFKEHMLGTHSTSPENIDIPTLKKLEEMEMPLEEIQFREKSIMRYDQKGRPAGFRSQDGNQQPVGPEEFTLERFKHNFIIFTKSGVMLCSICPKVLSPKTWKPHILEHHVLTKYIFCEICDESFNSEPKLKEHMGLAHKGNLKCVLQCQIQFTEESKYLKHMKSEHNQPNIKPSGRIKKDNLPIEEVLFTDEHPNLAKMPTCCFEYVPDDIEMTREQFNTKYIRIKKDDHSRRHCLACGLGFAESGRHGHLKAHHTLVKQFACERCPSRFKFKKGLVNHMSSMHRQDYKCSICEIQLLKCQQLIDHNKDEHDITMNISPPEDRRDLHPDEIRYVRILDKKKADEDQDSTNNLMNDVAIAEKMCHYCNEKFKSQSSLHRHLRQCKSIPNNNNGKIEQESTQEVKQFPCEFCDIICTSFKSLVGHTYYWHKRDPDQTNTSSQSKKKPTKNDWEFECDICNETSIAKEAYTHIKRCHTGEFKCGQCQDHQSSTFLRLKQHIVVKHPRKIKLDMSQRDKCPHCFRYFAVADCLNDHIKSKHSNVDKDEKLESLFRCEACEMRFKSEELRDYHLQTEQHRRLQRLFDKETERDLAGTEEVYGEEQDSEFDQNEQDHDETTSELNSMRKRRHTNSFYSSSLSISSATETEVSHEDDYVSPPVVKKEKLDAELIEISTAADNNVSYLNFMRYIDDYYECALCNAKTQHRKIMLQHLKEHDEVP